MRAVLWCPCGTQIVGYGFADAANPPTGIAGPWLCLFCAARAATTRPGEITQAFTTEPVKPGSVWTFPSQPLCPLIVVEDECYRLAVRGPLVGGEPGRGKSALPPNPMATYAGTGEPEVT
jgi:hypothetical protein